jgi:hypothetical protein
MSAATRSSYSGIAERSGARGTQNADGTNAAGCSAPGL